jgi:8-amino-7-oxononanoate synthase
MGTLSKAVGAYGGYLCASAPVIELMRNRARTLVYSTGLPPAVVAASIAALDFINSEPEYCAQPLKKAKHFTQTLGLPAAQSPIVPIVIGGEDETLAASRLLADHGFLVAAIRPPTVPPGTARLRFTFTAQHPDEQVARLAGLVRQHIVRRA